MAEIFVGIDGTTPDWDRAVHFSDPDDEKMSFIGALYRGSAADKENKHWFAGPDIRGVRVPECVGMSLDFIMKARARLGGSARVTITGYSRGAYAAIRVAQGLGKARIDVDTLILLDTVKVTDASTEDRVGVVIDRYDDSFDIETEAQRLLRTAGPRSSIRTIADARAAIARRYGRTVEDEIYKADGRARDAGSWNWVDAIGYFMIPPNVKLVFSFQRDPSVKSRDWTMGVAPVTLKGNGPQCISRMFLTTHAGMGGMPFAGDIPDANTTRLREWKESRRLALALANLTTQLVSFQYFKHPLLDDLRPPAWWLNQKSIKANYAGYWSTYGSDGLTPSQDAELQAQVTDLRDAEARLDKHRPPNRI